MGRSWRGLDGCFHGKKVVGCVVETENRGLCGLNEILDFWIFGFVMFTSWSGYGAEGNRKTFQEFHLMIWQGDCFEFEVSF